MKFYKIPLTDRMIKIEGKSLIEILQEKFPELYEREMERINIQYEDCPGSTNPVLEKILKEYNTKTNLCYQEEKLPTYLLAIQKDDEIREYATNTPLTANHKTFTELREVTPEQFNTYLDQNPNYEEEIPKFLEQEKNKTKSHNLLQKIVNKLEIK